MPRKVSLHDLQRKRDKGQPITMLTAYDYPAAKLVDEAGVDAILVGDTLAMTVLGHRDTVSVTVDDMLHHCKAVARGASRALLVGDMPFMSYQISRREAVRNAGRYMKEAHMDAVKLEGGNEVAATVRAIVSAGVPVMGHVGLTPQTATKLGGYKVQATTAEAALKLRNDALALQEAGCFAVVLEAVPSAVAQAVTEKLSVPTIGIGAGAGCAGQVLVFHDVPGAFRRLRAQIRQAVRPVARANAASLAGVQVRSGSGESFRERRTVMAWMNLNSAVFSRQTNPERIRPG